MTKRITPWGADCKFCSSPFQTSRASQKFCSLACQRNNVNKIARTKVKHYNSHLMAAEARKIPLTQLQKELLYGTLLGDGSLTATRKGENKFLLRFTHCERQKPYLEFKTKMLASIFQGKLHKSVGNASFGSRKTKFRTAYRAHSIYHGDLAQINSILYINVDGKRVKTIGKNYLDLLTHTSLLFWYLDDGTVDKSYKGHVGTIELSTNSFTLKEVETMVSVLRKKFSLPQAKVRKLVTGAHTIRLGKESAVKLLSLLSTSPLYKDVPECMRYKL